MFAIGIWLLAAARYRDRVSEAMTELDESGAESNPAPRPRTHGTRQRIQHRRRATRTTPSPFGDMDAAPCGGVIVEFIGAAPAQQGQRQSRQISVPGLHEPVAVVPVRAEPS